MLRSPHVAFPLLPLRGEVPSLSQQSREGLPENRLIDQHLDNRLAKTAPIVNFARSPYGVFCQPTAVPLFLDNSTLFHLVVQFKHCNEIKVQCGALMLIVI